MTVQKFIFYSTIFAIFASALSFKVFGITIQFFYFLMALNLFLMFLLRRFWVPAGLVGVVGVLLFSGVIGKFQGTDDGLHFMKEFVGISISGLYFCCFFRTFHFDLEACFRAYARVAYWVAVLGFVLLPIRGYLFGEVRLRSVLLEPALFAFCCLPAIYFYADQWQRGKGYGREAVIMLIAMVFAASSLGFLGMLFGIVLFGMRYSRRWMVFLGLAIVIAIATYFISDRFQVRVDDTFQGLQRPQDVRGENLSSYVLTANLYVTKQVLATHPIFGNGLGSHRISADRYIDQVLGSQAWRVGGYEMFNADDAASLALRILSDMGVVGLILTLWFIWLYRPRGDGDILDVIGNAILIYFFMKLVRGGVYFINEEYFFTVMYFLCAKVRKQGLIPVSAPEVERELNRVAA